MSVPAPLLEVMQLLEDVTRKKGNLSVGPFRVEVEPEALLESPRNPVLAEMLTRAYFLAPILSGLPTRALLGELGTIVDEHDLYLDLVIPGLSALEGLPEHAALRTARVEMQASHPEELLSSPDLVHGSWGAALVAGRTTFRIRVESSEVHALPPLLDRMATFSVPVDLVLAPCDMPAREAVRAAWSSIDDRASTAGLNVLVKGDARSDAGESLDPLSGFNVLDECIRAIFRSRRSLCPFPFLMVRWAQEEVAVCPAEAGPAGPIPSSEPWNGALHQGVREAFYEGEPPVPCRRCTLLAQVRRSAEETPWSKREVSDGRLPPGALEV